MKKEYVIKREDVKVDRKDIVKYNIYYFFNGELETKEFHSTDGINGEIRVGYVENNNLNK
jgi:hypothetical protein